VSRNRAEQLLWFAGLITVTRFRFRSRPIDRVPFEVKWNQVVYIPPPPAAALSTDSGGARMRMVQDVSGLGGIATLAAFEGDAQKLRVQGISLSSDGINSMMVPMTQGETIPITSTEFTPNQTHGVISTPEATTPSHSLRLGSHVMLTPGLIGLLSENPLLRASLKGLGLGG
jgi:hypothetical protein